MRMSSEVWSVSAALWGVWRSLDILGWPKEGLGDFLLELGNVKGMPQNVSWLVAAGERTVDVSWRRSL